MHRVMLLLFLSILSGGCSEEQQNRLSRLGVTWMEGNYRVTYADGSHVKSWEVHDGKVTSEPGKGYYFFWANEGKKRYYVPQTEPRQHTHHTADVAQYDGFQKELR